jgi:hypothetical protein
MAQLTVDRVPPRPVDKLNVATKPQPSRDEVASFWPFVWTLFAFKIVTMLVIWFFAIRSTETSAILGFTHWFWLFIPMAAVAGPMAFQWRLRKVRRRRAQLQAAEWMVEELR